MMLGSYFTDESKILWKDTGFVREAMKYIKNSNYLGGYIISGTPTDGQVPTYDAGTDTITWESAGGGGSGTVTAIYAGEGLKTSLGGDPATTPITNVGAISMIHPIIVDSFNVTYDGITTDFTTTIPSTYTKSVCQIKDAIDLGRDVPQIISSRISGTTLTVQIAYLVFGGAGWSPLISGTNIIDYIISK